MALISVAFPTKVTMKLIGAGGMAAAVFMLGTKLTAACKQQEYSFTVN
jgi:hypothetical protein